MRGRICCCSIGKNEGAACVGWCCALEFYIKGVHTGHNEGSCLLGSLLSDERFLQTAHCITMFCFGSMMAADETFSHAVPLHSEECVCECPPLVRTGVAARGKIRNRVV